MYRLGGLWSGIALSLCALSVYADSAVTVDALNYPAWLLRNYQTLPLQPGTRLRDDDLIRTGKGGRVQLRLADGSAIRLGESSRFVIRQAAQRPVTGDTTGPLSFQALRGVVRVSSAFFDADGPRHRLELKIGAINATVGKADIWGRTDLAQDALCLVEGELGIEVSTTSAIDMSQELSCFVKPRDQPPLPVDLIDLRQHRLWMAETDLKMENGIVSEDGQWQLVLISLTNAQRAGQVLSDFHRRGYAVRDKTVLRDGRILHRLLLPGFDSKDAALAARDQLEHGKPIESAIGTGRNGLQQLEHGAAVGALGFAAVFLDRDVDPRVRIPQARSFHRAMNRQVVQFDLYRGFCIRRRIGVLVCSSIGINHVISILCRLAGRGIFRYARAPGRSNRIAGPR
jgi:hypothetical protein